MKSTFVNKYSSIGPIAWIFTIQYLVITLVVSQAWSTYSFLHNSISDLGNTACRTYSNRYFSNIYICSPKHTLMNWSFAVTGILMIIGAVLIYPLFKKRRATMIGFTCIAIGGIGGILVGIYPENTIGTLHVAGAFLDFFVGNIGIMILGFSLLVPKWLRIYTLITGFLTLSCLVFYSTKIYLGLGVGGMERLASYPQTIWLMVFGYYLIIMKSHKN